jgi:hypothetical protein
MSLVIIAQLPWNAGMSKSGTRCKIQKTQVKQKGDKNSFVAIREKDGKMRWKMPCRISDIHAYLASLKQPPKDPNGIRDAEQKILDL